MARNEELAAFLRARRERLRPSDVGLPDGHRRRTPGLRRQEVAELARISVDYYIRLEQARGPTPSRQVLGALARALMLTADERDYLFRLVGVAAPQTRGPSREVPTGVRRLLDTLVDTPAFVVDARYDVIDANPLGAFFLGFTEGRPAGGRNLVRELFTGSDDAGSDQHCAGQDEATRGFAHGCVADLRAAMARYPGDRGITDLVTEMLATSPRFVTMWEEHSVAVSRSYSKRVQHPVAGPLEFTTQLLHIPDSDQRLIVYTAAPGTATADAFAGLAARVP